MKKTVCRIATVSCLIFAAAAPLAWGNDGMMHHGEFAERMFNQMDANHDGAVTKKEFDAFHDKWFEQMDTNHDGKITREEMEAAHQKMAVQAMGRFKERFDEADANHDGALSKEEAQKMPFLAQHFDEIDANHDGKVTMDEIKAAHGKMHGYGGMMNCDGMHGDQAHCDLMPGGTMHGDGMMK